jgi:anti-sigma regulatory factor (Ser/Thr protein kinase)
MSEPHLHSFPATLEAFDAIREQLDISVSNLDWKSDDIHRCTLILEELFTNSVKYGTSAGSDNHVYLGIIPAADRSIALTYEDRAPHYDPFAEVSTPHYRQATALPWCFVHAELTVYSRAATLHTLDHLQTIKTEE